MSGKYTTHQPRRKYPADLPARLDRCQGCLLLWHTLDRLSRFDRRLRQSEIAGLCGLSVRWVSTHAQHLEALRLLTREGPPGDPRGQWWKLAAVPPHPQGVWAWVPEAAGDHAAGFGLTPAQFAKVFEVAANADWQGRVREDAGRRVKRDREWRALIGQGCLWTDGRGLTRYTPALKFSAGSLGPHRSGGTVTPADLSQPGGRPPYRTKEGSKGYRSSGSSRPQGRRKPFVRPSERAAALAKHPGLFGVAVRSPAGFAAHLERCFTGPVGCGNPMGWKDHRCGKAELDRLEGKAADRSVAVVVGVFDAEEDGGEWDTAGTVFTWSVEEGLEYAP